MKKVQILLLFPMLIFACSQRGQKDLGKSSEDSLSVNQKTESTSVDSLRDPHSLYYYSEIPPRRYAELIMKDSITPGDNLATQRLLDSLDAGSFDSRKYYFQVVTHIMKNSDGALSEEISSKVFGYVNKSPKEFLKLSETLSSREFKDWVFFLAGEVISGKDDMSHDAKKLYEKLLKNSDKTNKNKVDSTYKMIKQHIRDNLK
ncbi:MAG: hypothetical protein QM654_00250 [Dysgonamonadaceae bacterium]